MKVYIAAIVVVVALISVALATNLSSSNIQNCSINSPQQTTISQLSDNVVTVDKASDSLIGTSEVSFGVVAQEIITTALLVIGSIAVLKKK
jgi:hypothetical protein